MEYEGPREIKEVNVTATDWSSMDAEASSMVEL
jgi:hypothetical protein